MSTDPPSLAAMLEQTGPLHWREAARLTARIARALDRLHAQRPAHGGIEPLTVLFVGGTVRLADPLPEGRRHTAFLAPTVAAGEPADRQSDFFALGRTMAAMLAPLEPGLATGPEAPLATEPASLPPPLLAVQRRLVASDSTLGYGSGNDVAAALELALAASEGFAAEIPPQPAPSPPDQPPPSLARAPSPAPDLAKAPEPRVAPPVPVARRRARRPQLALALLALVLVGVLAAIWLRPSGEIALEQPLETTRSLPPAPAVVAVEPLPEALSSPSSSTEALPLDQVLAALPDIPLAPPRAAPPTMVAVAALFEQFREAPCTRLELEPTTLGLRLVGRTASPERRTQLLAAIGALDDLDKVSVGLDRTARFCRLYDMLAAHAEPAMPRLVELFPARTDYRLAAGEPLVLRVLTPDFPSYLMVDYFTADGMVVHLAERRAEADPWPPVEAVWIGDPADGQWLTIAEPFGDELIVVIASRQPLFAEPRSKIEPAEVYLDALETALARQASRPTASTIAIETIAARD